MKYIVRLAFVATSMLSLGVSAQWLWVDKDGRKVFSDRSPPSDILEKNILKRPGQTKARVAPEGGAEDAPKAAAPAASATSAATPKMSALDKELADRKKKAELAEESKRKAEEEKMKQAKAENCERAKSAKANLDSGIRIARVNQQGEREVMDDAARAAETKRVQAIVDSECK
jgi:type IV secretory pathway VirB10-like protein